MLEFSRKHVSMPPTVSCRTESKKGESMKYFVAILVLVIGTNAFAYKSGSLTCHFEILSKQSFPKFEKLPEFKINAFQSYFEAVKVKSLPNNILVSYSPGIDANKDLILSMDVKYDGAEGGSDVPAVNNQNYTFYVSKDFSELVGAYLKCRTDLMD